MFDTFREPHFFTFSIIFSHIASIFTFSVDFFFTFSYLFTYSGIVTFEGATVESTHKLRRTHVAPLTTCVWLRFQSHPLKCVQWVCGTLKCENEVISGYFVAPIRMTSWPKVNLDQFQ